jgi:uncharacterized Zn-binding protein involved in type VI secretion
LQERDLVGGFPAARLTDPTDHGGIITLGCATVLIGALPAARIGDMHVCPMVTGIVPHVGGPLILGSFTVITGGVPQSRVTDMLICVGPPDMVAMGAPNVMVGMVGAGGLLGMLFGLAMGGLALASRYLGGTTAPTVSIEIQGDDAFKASARAALATIFPTRSGREWLRQMGKNGQKVTIIPTAVQNGACSPGDATNAANGKGTGSTIEWNPSHNTTDPGLPGAQGSPGAPVILFHEMTHALHNGNGDERDGPDDSFPDQDGSSARNEERSTVGTSGPIRLPDGTIDNDPPDYSGDFPTENSLRDDLGIPRRPSYYPSNWPGGAPW